MKTPYAGAGAGKLETKDKEPLAYKYPEGDLKFEEDLKKDLQSDRRLEVHSKTIRTVRAFRNAFAETRHKDAENFEFYVMGAGHDVAFTRAFGLKNAENFTMVTDTRADAEMMQGLGYNAIKAIPEHHHKEGRADIVMIMDEKINATWRTLRNVLPGGWLMLPLENANAARTGKFKFMGVVETSGVYPSVDKSVGTDFWDKAEITSDQALQNAEPQEGVVTYQEAAAAVWNAYHKSSDILENYKKLIREAKDQNPAHVASGEHELTYKMTDKDGNETVIPVNTVLPLEKQKIEHGNYAIFKKYETV